MITNRLLSLASGNRRRVAIASLDPSVQFIADLEPLKDTVDLILVGKPASSFECVPTGSGKEVAEHLFSLHLSGQVDAVVRGQLDYTTFHDAMNQALALRPARHGHRDLQCPYLVSDALGRDWFITPMVQHDDATEEGRLYLASGAASIVSALGIEPVIGVLAADNAEELFYSERVNASVRDSQRLVTRLQRMGLHARNLGLRIDRAAAECNIVVPPDGTVGNFVYRSLGYLGGATLVGGFTLSNRIVSLDTSRYNDKFGLAVGAAAAIANLRGVPVREYSDWTPPDAEVYETNFSTSASTSLS